MFLESAILLFLFASIVLVQLNLVPIQSVAPPRKEWPRIARL